MAIERTFSMIKPDATRRNLTGAITKMLEEAGLRVIASRRVWMSRREAEGFYAVHKDRPFFGELVEFMSSGPVVAVVIGLPRILIAFRSSCQLAATSGNAASSRLGTTGQNVITSSHRHDAWRWQQDRCIRMCSARR